MNMGNGEGKKKRGSTLTSLFPGFVERDLKGEEKKKKKKKEKREGEYLSSKPKQRIEKLKKRGKDSFPFFSLVSFKQRGKKRGGRGEEGKKKGERLISPILGNKGGRRREEGVPTLSQFFAARKKKREPERKKGKEGREKQGRAYHHTFLPPPF